MPRPKKHPSSDRKISTEWFHGLDPAEQEAFEKAWRNSTYVTDRLRGILERHITELEVDAEDDYKNPNWPIARADKNGQLRVYKKILRLLP